MLLRKFTAIALLCLVSAGTVDKEDDSFEETDDNFYDSRGELIVEDFFLSCIWFLYCFVTY